MIDGILVQREIVMMKRVSRIVMGPLFCVLFLTPWMLGNSECNAFVGTADKGTGPALIYSARQLIDKGDYTGALAQIALLSPADRVGHDGRIVEATAYAGRCGLNLVNLANDVATLISSKKLMEILLSNMKGAASEADCTSSEGLVVQIPAADMSSDDYAFLAFVEFARIGSLLRRLVDANKDGVVDGDTICSAGTSGGANYTDTDAGTIGVAFNRAIAALNSSGVTLGGSFVTSYQAACAAGLNCTVQTTNGYTAMEARALRTLARTNDVGLKTCATGSGAFSDPSCFCP